MKRYRLILSCEHAVNTVPNKYSKFFKNHEAILSTHRGIDFGANEIADFLSDKLECKLTKGSVTRLLIDCNRSVTNKHCFSEFTNTLSQSDKQELIDQYYLPFRTSIATQIQNAITNGEYVLHLSIHSFTPIFNNITRNTDIGLLYDPTRLHEKQFSHAWREQLKQNYRVRLNYPYQGTSDGHTTALRKQYGPDVYAGIEVESNQSLVQSQSSLENLSYILAKSLKLTCLNYRKTWL